MSASGLNLKRKKKYNDQAIYIEKVDSENAYCGLAMSKNENLAHSFHYNAAPLLFEMFSRLHN
jgi:hypothetical protein